MGWRRRYCPSPILVVLLVAVCVFYQCFTLLWRNTSWTIKKYEIGTHEDLLNVTTQKNCLYKWGNIVRKIKDYEDRAKKNLASSAQGRALLHIHPSLANKESILYKRILTHHGYTVLQFADIDSVKSFVKHHQHSPGRDVLIYISSNKSVDARCKEMRELAELPQLGMVNILPQMQQLLCKKDKICEMAVLFPELHNLSICATYHGESWEKKSISSIMPNNNKKKIQALRTWDIHPLLETYLNLRFNHHHHPSPDAPRIRTFVLITSLSPLRAFIHSIAMVQIQPNKPFAPIKLQHFSEQFLKSKSPLQMLNALKEMISKLLLTLEVMSEVTATGQPSANRCNECFQLLTFDIGYHGASPPTVLQVKEHFEFSGLNLEDHVTMEIILEDVFKFILQNNSLDFLEVLEKAHECPSAKENICWLDPILGWTWKEMDTLLIFVQELTNLGKFEMLYPSTSVLLKALRNDLYHRAGHIKILRSVLAEHELLSALFECLKLQNKFASTKRQTFHDKAQNELSAASGTVSAKAKLMNCSDDNDTLSYIKHIFSNPTLELTPEFNPKIKDYYAELAFDVVSLEIGAEPTNCKSQVHLDSKDGPRVAKYPLGLGLNQITLHVTDESKPSPLLLRSYRITVYREDRPSLPLFDHYKMCGFVQDCGLIMYVDKPCGLQYMSSETLSVFSQAWQRKCQTGDAKGQWVVPCLSCSDNRTCDWRAISWQPYYCHHPVLPKHDLRQCLKERKIIFIGDSTNRGMMYYLIERVNGTLTEWQKTHDMKFYNNINYGRTSISYSYYPQFWIDIRQRPTFEKALEHLIARSRPLKNTNQTILVVGGVQWLNSDHLEIIHKVLNRENLLDILVIIKTIGMGFHLPVHGIRSLSAIQVRNLFDENTLILKTAKLYGYEVVDTFSITMGRYKEFLQGKCGCHYHEVVKSEKVKEKRMELLKSYTFGGKIFPQVQDNPSDLKSLYHVQGPVNQVYSEILLSRMCA
ncbi:cadherin-like and PC-esterase domain-containing protein 1 [Mixophyes fleayi]|uniref:cadherin-like and PC-esterase domain-containing protein 1 n=1 Tax=Mixophyes fleayi TaxID=3061075 RepID=UPI003F4E402B